MTKVFFAIGANLATENRALDDQVRAVIHEFADDSLIVSQLYRTPAFPAGSGPDFVNAAIGLDTNRTAEECIAWAHKVEEAFGRVRETRWSARVCDVDLLFYGDYVWPSENEWQRYADFTTEQAVANTPDRLILPHPRLHERAFVLAPMRDIAADFIHPVLGLSIETLWNALPKEDRTAISVIAD